MLAPCSPIELFCFYTSNFEPMLIRFLSGIKDNIVLNCFNLEARGVGGVGGGKKVWEFKTELLIKSAEPSAGKDQDIVLFTDIDLAVYRPMRTELVRALESGDIALQRERDTDDLNVNIGVICFRRSARVMQFWKDVLARVKETGEWDQAVVNILVNDPAYLAKNPIRIEVLSRSFWAKSQSKPPPGGGCVLHHANCENSLVRKWKQLNNFAPFFTIGQGASRAAFDYFEVLVRETDWIFGAFENPRPYGTMRFDSDLNVVGYVNKNESRLVLRDSVALMLNADGLPSCVFNEFYLDSLRKKIVAVGPIFGVEDKFHYLMSNV